jgi:hypothetical protein
VLTRRKHTPDGEAVRVGLPIAAFVEVCERERRQEEFLKRVRGTWSEESNLTASFGNVDDLRAQVVAALVKLERQAAAAATRPAAEQRAAELARGASQGSFSTGSPARLVYVPLIAGRLIDDLTLNHAGLGDELSAMARESGLARQQLGIEARITGTEGITLQVGPARSEDSVAISVGLDGSVMAEGPVAGTGPYGSSLIDPDRLEALIRNSGRFAAQAWKRLDAGSQVAQLAAAVGIPSAQSRVYGRSEASSLSMGGLGRLPATLVVPEPVLLARREDIGGERLGEQLLSAVERRFRDNQSTVGL